MKQWLLILGWCLTLPFSLLCIPSVDVSSFDICECSHFLDPQTQSILKQLNAENCNSLDEETLKTLQNMPLNIQTKIFPQIQKIENIQIPGPIGPIKARLYFPRVNTPLPVFIFFHGGGWALGCVEQYDEFCQEFCHRTPCLVVSVQYHLAPQHKFPEPLNDCYVATKWIAEYIQQFGGDPSRLAIGGDSAGGNLAAAVTLMARDKGTPKIHHQVLIFPALNAQFDTVSYFLFANGYYLTREIMQFFWKMYLQQEVDGKQPYASPLQATSLTYLPPALVLVANFDPLRDEGLAYAWRLHQDQVPITLKRYPTIHGFISFGQEFTVARQGIQEIIEYLQQGFYSQIQK